MKWILILWAHSLYGYSDQTTFEQFDSQEECMKAGEAAVGKTEGHGDFAYRGYVFVCSSGGVPQSPKHE